MGMNCRFKMVATALVLLMAATVAHAKWVWTPEIGRFVNIDRLPKETAELQVEHARRLMLEGDYKKALRETEKFMDFYEDSPWADRNQFVRGEIRMAQGKYLAAAKEFQQVISNYPDTELFDEVVAKQYEAGNILYDQGRKRMEDWWRLFRKKPLKQAIELYRMVIDNQPFSGAAAEAQYRLGLCHMARNEYIEAAYEYRRLMEDYPASDWVDDASYGLAKCYYEQSHPPEYDQMPSRLAIEAIDEFEAAYPRDERVAELEEKRGEMVERTAWHKLQIARFYAKRRQFPSARVYYEVVADQFPDTAAAESARGWLDAHPNAGLDAVTRLLGMGQ